VQDHLGPAYFALDWTAQHGNFFQALRTEKTVMFVILALIVAVAAFNIVATLVMAVVEKRGDIAILRTIGLSPYSIMAIFVLQGVLITCIGVVLGVVGGIVLSDHINAVANFLEHTFQLRLVPADVYGIGSLPSRLEASDVLRIVALALGLGLLATLYPAWRAAMGQPAEALRYE
jgi:lipoprotein-releasing system permease protein